MEKTEIQKKSLTGIIIKGSLYSLCMSLVLILIFAFALRIFAISDNAIAPIVSVIKGVSILFGVIWALKKSREMGFVSGLIIGFVYVIISFITFSILDGFSFEFSRTLLNDFIFGGIVGGISGIIAVNFFTKKIDS